MVIYYLVLHQQILHSTMDESLILSMFLYINFSNLYYYFMDNLIEIILNYILGVIFMYIPKKDIAFVIMKHNDYLYICKIVLKAYIFHTRLT